MNINRPASLIPRPARESSMTNARANNSHVQTSNSPASEISTASTSHSHQYGCTAFLLQTDLAQTFLLKQAKSSVQKNVREFLRGFDASRWSPKSRIELASYAAEKNSSLLAENIQKFEIAEESVRIELARIVAKEDPYGLAENIHNFDIADESVRTAIVEAPQNKRLLNKVREHVTTLKELKEGKVPPRNFIGNTRDAYKSELLIEEIIASENERTAGLNLSLCRTAKAFSSNINELAENGTPGQKARYITTVHKGHLWHVIAYEASVIAPGKIYIRGFDSLPETRSQKYFEVTCDNIKATCKGKNHQVKLDTFATGQQHSPSGCDIFSLSFALKSLDEQFDVNSINFEEGKQFDFQLIDDEKAARLPITYYKHAQPRDIIDRIKENSRYEQDIDKPINKKGLSFEQRYKANETTQNIYSLTTGTYQRKTFSDSIDAKRIAFYERLIQRLEQRLQA
jgi:hypothetical protein